nr:hypothetical protein [Pirellula staleyi]
MALVEHLRRVLRREEEISRAVLGNGQPLHLCKRIVGNQSLPYGKAEQLLALRETFPHGVLAKGLAQVPAKFLAVARSDFSQWLVITKEVAKMLIGSCHAVDRARLNVSSARHVGINERP